MGLHMGKTNTRLTGMYELLKKDGVFSRMWQDYQTSVQWKVEKEVR